mgnify:CR=1 FL=1
MKHTRLLLALPAVLLAGAGPAAAQDPDDNRSLMQEGAELFWEGLRREMRPALEALRDQADEMEPALRDFIDRMGPALADLMEQMGDLSAYHAPEKLPNGDIILRRKTPQERETPLPDQEAPAPEGEIEI